MYQFVDTGVSVGVVRDGEQIGTYPYNTLSMETMGDSVVFSGHKTRFLVKVSEVSDPVASTAEDLVTALLWIYNAGGGSGGSGGGGGVGIDYLKSALTGWHVLNKTTDIAGGKNFSISLNVYGFEAVLFNVIHVTSGTVVGNDSGLKINIEALFDVDYYLETSLVAPGGGTAKIRSMFRCDSVTSEIAFWAVRIELPLHENPAPHKTIYTPYGFAGSSADFCGVKIDSSIYIEEVYPSVSGILIGVSPAGGHVTRVSIRDGVYGKPFDEVYAEAFIEV